MKKIKAAVHSFGNIGHHVVDSLDTASDFECIGIIRRKSSIINPTLEFESLEALSAANGKPDVIILCGPSRHVANDALPYLTAGINTVDSFDIHGEIADIVTKLHSAAVTGKSVAITAAGWDPGSDSVLRALFEAMTPTGTTFTNFGRGRSMGHSVAARSIEGVADATSITIPMGGGRHSRLVYVLPTATGTHDAIRQQLAADPYFSHDPLDIRFVSSPEELAAVADQSHGVRMERTGASGSTSNQQLVFDMRINNPALTAQVLVSCARATTRMAPGGYTMIDIPPVAMLPGDRMDHIRRFV